MDPFETVNYYPLMCHLLDISPSPNNGSLDLVRHLLKDSGGKSLNGGILESLVTRLLALHGLIYLFQQINS